MKDITETTSIEEFIEVYEYEFENSIDLSPGGIQRATRKMMLGELKELDQRMKHD